MNKLSAVIPSHNDIYLHRTIQDILENAECDVEVIPVLDGYRPKTPLSDDPRIKPLFLEKNVGMRDAINAGVDAATGDCLMRTDEHCCFGKGFGRIIMETIQPNWIVVPRRYFLDPVNWEVMPIEPIDYEKLKITNYERGQKFSGVPWMSRAEERKDIPIDETMAMQGSCWFMPTSWWKKVIVNLQSTGYGTHYQDSHEMIFKTWKAGGLMMLNKLTWYAHKHRLFPRTHGYGGKAADDGYAYALECWRDYYENEIRPRWKI